ncbi:MAG: hypothetical protein DCC67_00150 [Planctomycetota bacterium]|nr:MAG: hypothetical protein DCC67_00150 [Planctomycetota bacterium]
MGAGRLWRPLLVGVVMACYGCGGPAQSKTPPSATLLLDAQEAIRQGDDAKALELLNASIESQPTVWNLMERARLNARLGNDEAAKADCQQMLQVEPTTPDAAWIEAELKKPVGKRFEGKFASPPSHREAM